MRALHSLSSQHSPRHLQWLLTLPKLGVILLMIALISLLWLVHKNEAEEQRSALIKDVLWLEQNLRFHLSGNEEQLQQMAQEMGNPQERARLFRLRATHLLKNVEFTHAMELGAHADRFRPE